MSIFLTKCLLRNPYQKFPESLRKVDQELQGGCISIFLTKCLSKLKKSTAGASRMIYEYIPYHITYQMFLKSLRKVAQELQGGYMSIFFTKCLLKA